VQPLDLALAIQGRPAAPNLRAGRRDRRRSQRLGSASRRSGDLRAGFAA
jgi:hypothetical protein